MPYGTPMILVFWCQRSRRHSIWFTPMGAPNRGGAGYNQQFSTNILLGLYLRNCAR